MGATNTPTATKTTEHASEPSQGPAHLYRPGQCINTLETRMSDSLDFEEVAVWTIRAALEAAYLAGMVDQNRR